MKMEQHGSQISYLEHCNGSISIDTIADLRNDWIKKLETCSGLVVDLSGVEYIDWDGLLFMLQIHEKAESDGKHANFTGCNSAIEHAMYVFHWFADISKVECSLPSWAYEKNAMEG